MFTNLERIKGDIENISKFNATPGNGLTRMSFTKEDKGAREYIKNEMVKAGLKVYEDAAGTVVGRLDGNVDGPVIMVGSHFDSVRCGGNFDGPAGVVTGLEIARTIKENNIKVKYPIEFIAMIEEEGGRFGGGLFGSRAMVGSVTREELDTFKDSDGVSIAKAMADFGFNPNKISEAIRKKEDIKAFLELHIEQGPILEKDNLDVGLVEYVVGINQIEVTFTGRPDHAGTTPMDMRADALDAASCVISQISGLAKDVGDGTVATVGSLKIQPGAANIVPGIVTFTVDIRSKKADLIEKVKDKIKTLSENIANSKDVKLNVVDKLAVKPTKLSEEILSIFKKNSDKLNFSNKLMLSGAGHDAMVMAGITEVGLVFVPSKDGRSHCPQEWTDYDKLQKGIELVYETILNLAEVM